MTSVFGEDMDALLQTDRLKGTRSVREAASRSFNTGGMARMDGSSVESGGQSFTPEGTLDRELYLEAAIGALLERQATFGPLLRYPRTVVVGPRGSFACDRGRGVDPSDWKTELVEPAIKSNLYARDIDRIVWIKHCPKSAGVPVRGYSPPTIVINVATFRQDARRDAIIPTELASYRYRGDETTGGFTKGLSLTEEFDVVCDNLGLKRKEQGVNYEYGVSSVTPTPSIDVYDSTVDDLSYVKNAVSRLEFLMREDVSAARKSVSERLVDAEVLYRAVLAGVVPYAREDLEAARSATPRPAPPPGEATINRMMEIMGTLYGYKSAQSLSRPMSTDASATSPNPYAAIASASAAGSMAAVAEGKRSNPYSSIASAMKSSSTSAGADFTSNPYAWAASLGPADFVGDDDDDNTF